MPIFFQARPILNETTKSLNEPGIWLCYLQPMFFCFALYSAKVEKSHLLTPHLFINNVAPQGQTKQNLKPLWKFLNHLNVWSVLKNTDLTSANWLIVFLSNMYRKKKGQTKKNKQSKHLEEFYSNWQLPASNLTLH